LPNILTHEKFALQGHYTEHVVKDWIAKDVVFSFQNLLKTRKQSTS